VDVLKRIEELLEPPLADRGYEIVRAQVSGLKTKTLQIMIDRLDGTGINLDDCEQVSRCVSVLLDQDDPLSGAYRLEISSPGLERPLVKLRDYQRFMGHEIVLKTQVAIDNRKIFQGKLEFASEVEVVLTVKNSANEPVRIVIPFADIKAARLHVTLTNPMD
jgi:ribosome maturation factor RimP